MQPQTLKSFFRRRAIVILAVLVVCLLAFIYAMQITSVMTLSDEVMRTRVQYAIGTDTTVQSDEYLSRFFTDEYLKKGDLQRLRATYDGINVTSYIQLASVQWVWTWPWGGTAYVKIHDSVSNILGDISDEEGGATSIAPWPTGLYSMTLVSRNGMWLVEDMELISLDPVTQTPQPTE